MSNVITFPRDSVSAVGMLRALLDDAIEHEKRGKDFQVCIVTVRTDGDSRKYKTAFSRMPGEHILAAAAFLGKDAMAIATGETPC